MKILCYEKKVEYSIPIRLLVISLDYGGVHQGKDKHPFSKRGKCRRENGELALYLLLVFTNKQS